MTLLRDGIELIRGSVSKAEPPKTAQPKKQAVSAKTKKERKESGLHKAVQSDLDRAWSSEELLTLETIHDLIPEIDNALADLDMLFGGLDKRHITHHFASVKNNWDVLSMRITALRDEERRAYMER